MFEKVKLKGKIKKLSKQIEMIEQRRARSQGALVEAILKHTTPRDEDVDYFNRYTEEIEGLRTEMHEMQKKLDAMN